MDMDMDMLVPSMPYLYDWHSGTNSTGMIELITAV